MIMYVFINFPSNWVLDVKGIKKGIVTGGVLTVIGSGIRCLASYSFYFVIIGQVVCAIGQPFILNAPSKIAVRWFMPKNVINYIIKRSLALAVLSVVNIVGTAIGFIVPSLFVTDIDEQH
jgi:MFS family permease